MVKSTAGRLLAILTVVGACVFALPGSVSADPVGSNTSLAPDGDPQYGTTGNCSVYANASSYGLDCAAGGGQAQTVDELLGHKDPPTCWDTKISDDDAQKLYSLTIYAGFQWYQITCLTGLDVHKPIFDQPGLVVKQPPPVSIKIGAPDCPDPFQAAWESGYLNVCVMQLKPWQTKVAQYFQNQGEQIPGITMTASPSTRVRTGVPTAFMDVAQCDDCVSPTETTTLHAGGHAMNAVMTGFRIMPNGKGSAPSISCDGTQSVDDDATPQSDPSACWYTYSRASGWKPGRTYPLTAAATWQVNLDGAKFATFTKYAQIGLNVVDVQSLIISQTN